jgi:hypothetical protein
MKDLPSNAPEAFCLLSWIAKKIDTEIEENRPFQEEIDYFSKMFNFLCEGKLNLWLNAKASPRDVASIRSVYLRVLWEAPISLWPNYLYIFGLTYPSALPLWVPWLREEARTNPNGKEIRDFFRNHPSRWDTVDSIKVEEVDTLVYKRNEFLALKLAELVPDTEVSQVCLDPSCSTCHTPMPQETLFPRDTLDDPPTFSVVDDRHISTLFPQKALCDPPRSCIIDESVITCLVSFAHRFRSYDPTDLLRDGGPVYDILNEVNHYLRLNQNNTEESLLLKIQETEKELIAVCMTYLKWWHTNPSLEAQLLEVGSSKNPARHYYRASFAVNARMPATVPLWFNAQPLYLYAEFTDYAVTFSFQHCDGTRQSITLAWTEVPSYKDKILFSYHIANPKAPRVLARVD